MPFSRPEFQGVVFTNGAAYVGLYRRVKRNDTTSAVSTEYYYIRTNASGNLLDTRDNAIGGIFHANYETAYANPPSGYGSEYIDFPSTKEIGYLQQFPFDSGATSIARTKEEYDAAIARGATYVLIKFDWGVVFPTMAQQTTNAASSWTNYTNLIDYVRTKNNYLNKPMKLAFRISVDLDDSLHNDINGTNTSGFYNLSDSAKDEQGYVARIERGSGHTSLAHSTGVNQVLDFIQKVLQRYYPVLGSQLLWVSVSLTAQNEAGYNYENQYFTPGGEQVPRYHTTFDFSTHAVNGFKAAMQTKYGTTAALNAAWGSGYTFFSNITPPSSSGSNPDSVYATNKGKDWWAYHYGLVKSFMLSCKSLVNTHAPLTKFCTEWGSTKDWARRMSINVKDNNTYADMIKCEFGALAHKPDACMSLDVVRSNFSGKIGTELNDFDMVGINGATNPEIIKDYAIQIGRAAIENGAKDILIISDKTNEAYFNAMMDVLVDMKNYINTWSGTITTTATVNYSLGQMLENMDILKNSWSAAGGSNGSRINMVQSTDLGITPGSCSTPLSLYSLHSFCLSDGSIKSTLYVNGNDLLKADYHANKLRFLAATHSITYTETGDLAKTRWRVVGVNDGITYVKNEQNNGWRFVQPPSGEVGDARNNNHPDRRYIPSLTEDSVFYLPANQNYYIYMTNIGTVNVTFQIDSLDPSHEGIFVQKLTPGAGEQLYTLVTGSIPFNQIRTIKVNCNRYTTTDSL